MPPVVAASGARADDPVAHPLVSVSVRTIFVPDGFDDNDEVVLDGYLPSTCYSLSHTASNLDAATGEIGVTQYARRFPGSCIDAKIPFLSEVRLGVLPISTFKVKARGTAVASLAIKEALNVGPDDYLLFLMTTFHQLDASVATVKVAMTPDPVCVREDEPLAAAARELERRKISSALVTGCDGQMVGIFTEADAMRALASELEPG